MQSTHRTEWYVYSCTWYLQGLWIGSSLPVMALFLIPCCQLLFITPGQFAMGTCPSQSTEPGQALSWFGQL